MKVDLLVFVLRLDDNTHSASCQLIFNKVTININEGWIYSQSISSPSYHSSISYEFLAFTNTEHLGTTSWTYTLCGRFSVFHGYCFSVFHFPLSTAFHTICFQNLLFFQYFILILLMPACSSTPFLSSGPGRPSSISRNTLHHPDQMYYSPRAIIDCTNKAEEMVS